MKLENKNIGQSHLEDLCVINRNDLPKIIDYIIISIYDISETPVTKFKFKDWKKNVKKLLNLNSEQFDVSGIIEKNFISHLDTAGFFVDTDSSKKNDDTLFIYERGKKTDEFLLKDWKKHISLIEASCEDVKDFDHNKFIEVLFRVMYYKKRVIVIDKETYKKEWSEAGAEYNRKISNLKDKFCSNFANTYNITEEESEKLMKLSMKHIFDNGFPNYEELMLDFLNYKNS